MMCLGERSGFGDLTLNFCINNIKLVVYDDEVARVCKALGPLCEPLHETFAWAEQERRQRQEALDGPEYAWLGTHLTRALVHSRLCSLDLGTWHLTGNHARNGELWLTDGSYRIRVLHSPDIAAVPAPGTNRQRVVYYHNPPLGDVPLFGEPNDKLLALWRINVTTSAPSIQIVRPIGAWKFGATAMIDLRFALPEIAVDLENLFFEPSDEGLEIQMPNEEEGGLGDVGGIRR